MTTINKQYQYPAECSDPSCPCHEWSARMPVESPAPPQMDAEFHVSEAKNVSEGDSEPNSPILTTDSQKEAKQQ